MAESRLRAFVTQLPMPMAVLDGQFRFLEVNRSIAQLDGISAERHLGKTIGELFPDLALIINPVLERVATTSESVQIQIEITSRLPDPPAAARRWLISYVPILKDFEIVMLAVEITEHKSAEDALKRTRVELASKLAELEQGAMLGEMSKLLNAAITSDEAYRIIERFHAPVFSAGLGCALHDPRR